MHDVYQQIYEDAFIKEAQLYLNDLEKNAAGLASAFNIAKSIGKRAAGVGKKVVKNLCDEHFYSRVNQKVSKFADKLNRAQPEIDRTLGKYNDLYQKVRATAQKMGWIQGPPPPKKPNFFKRHPIVTGVGAVAGLGAGGYALGKNISEPSYDQY